MKNDDYKLIKENWDKFVEDEPEQLDEGLLPGVAWFLRSYQWLAPGLEILKRKLGPDSSWNWLLGKLASGTQTFKTAMDILYNKHEMSYMAIMGPIIALDPVGAATGKLKQIVLEDMLENMKKQELPPDLVQQLQAVEDAPGVTQDLEPQ